MPVIKLEAFRGEQPRIIPRQLPPSGAQVAVNARLDDGGLTPIQEPLKVDDALGTDHQTIYKFGDQWLSWSGVINAAPGPVDAARLYYTGDGVPKMLVAGTVYPLAVSPPATAPTVGTSGTGSGDVISRTYCYTWVTDFGEESEPSPATAIIDWQTGITVTLTGIESPDPDRNITKMRFYRSQTGQSGTGFYFIEERAAGNGDYVDGVAVDAFAEPLPSADWNAPPDTLSGLVAMANGIMAAFDGRDVYFCEPYRPHAWPQKYMQTVDADIVGLAALGTTLYILTKGAPHIAQGALPESMQINRAPTNLPCASPRGIANLGFCICYPSNEGLVRGNPDGSVGYVSLPLYDRDKWQKLSPATMIGAQHQGRFVGFYSSDLGGDIVEGCLTIDVGAEPFLWRASARASAAFYDVETGGLCYLPKGTDEIWRFDDPSGARAALYWRSKPFILPYPENFGVIQVDSDSTIDTAADLANYETLVATITAANQALLDAGPVSGELDALALNEVALGGDVLSPFPVPPGSLQVGVYGDGVFVASIDATNTPKRLPGGFRATTWEIDVAGTVPVTQIRMAKTMAEIKASP